MKGVFKTLKENLQGEVDYSGAQLGTPETPHVIKGNFTNIDLSGASGYVRIISDFTLRVDASWSNFSSLVLEGDFGIVDLSGAKIEKFNCERARVLYLDKSGSQVKKETPGH